TVAPNQLPPPSLLYHHFQWWCEREGHRAIPLQQFSRTLVDLCNTQLGMQVARIRAKQGTLITGLRLEPWPEEIPQIRHGSYNPAVEFATWLPDNTPH